MASGRLDAVVEHLRRLVAAETACARPDRELLERFVRDQDEAAFAALVRRHGPMVLAVCRRVLRHEQDAEDACQATFLVLARKASSVRKHDSLGCWLHGVAFRAASNLRRSVARRRARETPLADEPRVADAEVTWREVRTVLDEELRRLPARLQAPILLCCLEGRTRDEAAQELGWSLSTFRGRLERGRELLRARLSRRGVALSAALLGSLLSERAIAAVVPAALVVRVVRGALSESTAAGLASAEAAALAEGVLRAMTMTKLKTAAALLLAAGVAGFGARAWMNRTFAVSNAETGAAEQQPLLGGNLAADDRVEPAADSQTLARNQALSRLNLKHLALALNSYQNTYGHYPAPAYYPNMMDTGVKGDGGGMMGAMGPGLGGGMMMKPGGAARPMAAGMGMRMPGAPGMMGGPPGMAPGGAPGMPGMMGGMPGGPGGLRPLDVGSGMPAIAGKGGKALLSWRVAILPFLGDAEGELFRQFKLDEPWDGPHNKRLLKKMPKVFAPPGARTPEPYTTYYQVFVGPHAAFEKHRWMGMAQFEDGTANTILIAEAGNAVPWTKPEDLHFAPDEPLPELGGLFHTIFNAAFADGSVYALREPANPNGSVYPNLLRAAITRDGGEVVDLRKLKAPVNRRESELRRQNDRLRQELAKQQENLQSLRGELELLQEMNENEGTKQLKQENAELENQLRQLRDATEQLRREIQRLRQEKK